MTMSPYSVPSQNRATWGKLITAVPTAAVFLCQSITALSPGVGVDARYLELQYRQLADDPESVAHAMGWGVPPAATIPVTLQDVGDADWSLEPDELKF